MRALKVVLWGVGAIVGVGLLALGAVAAFVPDPTASATDQQDAVIGGILFMVVGAIALAIVVVTFVVSRRSQTTAVAPPLPPGMPMAAALPPQTYLGSDLQQLSGMGSPRVANTRDLYKEWHRWAVGQFGNNDVITHAATVAAVQAVMAGMDTSAAIKAAQEAAGRT